MVNSIIENGRERIYKGFSLSNDIYNSMDKDTQQHMDKVFLGEVELSDDNHIASFKPARTTKLALKDIQDYFSQIVREQASQESGEKELDSSLLDTYAQEFVEELNSNEKYSELKAMACRAFDANMRVNTLTLEPVTTSESLKCEVPDPSNPKKKKEILVQKCFNFSTPHDRDMERVNFVSKQELSRGWKRGATMVDTLEAEVLERVKRLHKEK